MTGFLLDLLGIFVFLGLCTGAVAFMTIRPPVTRWYPYQIVKAPPFKWSAYPLLALFWITAGIQVAAIVYCLYDFGRMSVSYSSHADIAITDRPYYARSWEDHKYWWKNVRSNSDDWRN